MARTKLSFASFNLFNLNIPGRRIYKDSDGWSQEEYDKKVKWSSQVIKSFGADIWGFQELWNIEALEDIFEQAGLKDEYDLLAPSDHKGNKIVCGAAVKKGLLVDEPAWIENFHEKFMMKSGGDDQQTSDISVNIDSFSRPPLCFKIKPKSDGKAISVYVAHFKSKRPTELYREGWYKDDNEFYKKHANGLGYAISTIRRTAEAAALRMFLTEEMKNTDTPVVVLGDLNDGQLSNTLNTLTEQPAYLLSGLSKGGTDNGLYTVGTLEEYRSLRDVYYTHIFKNIKESLDHILVSQEFYDNSKKRIWAYRGMEIKNDHLYDKNHKGIGTSDHGIIKANFEYRPI